MSSIRDVIVFLAGAEFFHTLSHGLLYWLGISIDMGFVKTTPDMNMWGAVANGVVTLLLLWWASRMGHCCHCGCSSCDNTYTLNKNL